MPMPVRPSLLTRTTWSESVRAAAAAANPVGRGRPGGGGGVAVGEIPDVMPFGVLAAVVAVVPAPEAAVEAALQIKPARQPFEADLPRRAVLERDAQVGMGDGL